MMFTMVVQLYTSRVVLNTLGVEDYGIYNVVGGIVMLFSFLYTAMTTSTQRFLTYELERGSQASVNKVFITSLQIHLLISAFIAIIAELGGLWFIHNKMVIPDLRYDAAIFVFHCSVLTSIFTIMSYPYNAVIVAHEKMSAFACISIIEVSLKLLIVFLLSLLSYDKLMLYALLMVMVQIFIQCIYTLYCRVSFIETKIRMIMDGKLLKEMMIFAGWNLWGNIASVFFGQGLNMLLNVFFGPVVNASRAIAVQVQTAVSQFAVNFQVAVNPQILKTYASNRYVEMHNLVYRSSKFTFLLLYILCLPILVETPFIIELWLHTVPEYTITFLRIVIITMIIDSTANPLNVSAVASGKIKTYQIVTGGIMIAVLPISYIVLALGGQPWTVFVVHLLTCVIAYIVRLYLVRSLVALKISEYFRIVIKRCFYVVLIATPLPLLLHSMVEPNWLNSILVIFLCLISCFIVSMMIGLDSTERGVITRKLSNIKSKLR